MSIRDAVDADRSGIAALHTESWRDAYRDILPAALLDGGLRAIMDARWAEQRIAPGDVVLVAEHGDAIVGFASTWGGEPPYIDNLHVARAHRSRGLGRALLAETARRLATGGRTSAYLHVVQANVRAQALYARLGGEAGAVELKDMYGTLVLNVRMDWRSLDALLAA